MENFSFETAEYNFRYIEPLYPSQVYENGLLPGMELYENQQAMIVKNFLNYIEFAKIKENEFEFHEGAKILTSRYFDSRSIGLSIGLVIKKVGKTVGWYVHGKIYWGGDAQDAIKHMINLFFDSDKKQLQYLLEHLEFLVERYA